MTGKPKILVIEDEPGVLMMMVQRLTQAGFEIRKYKYTGFGSYFFYDFLLFHKLLGIDKMLSIEHDSNLEKRVKYNRPFSCVEIKIDKASNIIPTLPREAKHLLWLDYDQNVNRDILDDLYAVGSQLSTGSIVLVTVDVEPPDRDSEEIEATKRYFEEETKKYLGIKTDDQYAKSNIPSLSKELLYNALMNGMSGRIGFEYFPLFYFTYADGHKMMTLGGMIGRKKEKTKLKLLDTHEAFYFRMNNKDTPYNIEVPIVTKKERHLLDSNMPCNPDWLPAEFEFSRDKVKVYREVYRFLPAYAELLL